MHRTLKQATAAPPAANRRRQQESFDEFRHEYNERRPHEALGQVPPARWYRRSARGYSGRLADPEYRGEWEVRRVASGGQFRWRTERAFAGHALESETIGLEPLEDDCWRVWFSFYELGVLDRHTKIWRVEEWAKRQQKAGKK